MKNFCLIFVLIASTSSLSAFSQTSKGTCYVPTVNKIDVDDIRRLTDPPCSLSLDALITSLPEEMRDSPAFVSDSKSLFGKCVDRLNPRVLYFTKKMVLAVPWKSNTEPQCKKVEVIGRSQFNKSLNPTFIDFQPKHPILDFTGNACISCHSTNFRPKWGSYPFWKESGTQTYAFRDDNVVVGSEEYKYIKQFFLNAQAQNKMSWFGSRAKNFMSNFDFLESEAKKEINRQLSIRENPLYTKLASLILPFVFTFKEFPDDAIRAMVKEYSFSSFDGGARSNMRLGIVLSEFNASTLADLVIARLGSGTVARELHKIGDCHFFNVVFPNEANNYLIPKLKIILQDAGFTGNELNLSINPSEADEAYTDGRQFGYEAFVIELLLHLGLSESDLRYYSHTDILGNPPGYYQNSPPVDETYTQFRSCGPVDAILNK